MSKHWIGSVDEYICPDCGFTTYSPAVYPGCVCPICGFQDEKDAHPICDCFRTVTSYSPSTRKNYNKYVCFGTKEIEECTCGGDESKCNFYAHKRKPESMDIPKGTNNYAVYYAHHRWKYGTEIEKYEEELIKRYFPTAKVCNPSRDIDISGKSEAEIMDDCLTVVHNADVVIFSAVSGTVGIGVYTEVEEALKFGKLVLYIYQDRLRTDFTLRINPNSTSDRLYGFVDVKGED